MNRTGLLSLALLLVVALTGVSVARAGDRDDDHGKATALIRS